MTEKGCSLRSQDLREHPSNPGSSQAAHSAHMLPGLLLEPSIGRTS